MAYCVNCGKEIADTDKFCSFCGTEKEQKENPTSVERKQEYAGKVIKCPSCGANLKSFEGVCESCGHEINSQELDDSLEEFIDAINKCDEKIAGEPDPIKKGFATWSSSVKVLWIIINIFTLFVPLVLYLVLPVIKIFLSKQTEPDLSANEKRKASLVENYAFPNEREAIVEALMFIKSKMAFLETEKASKKTLFFTNLWSTKAEQLNEKSKVVLKDDPIVKKTYSEILNSKNTIYSAAKSRGMIALFGLVVYVVLAVLVALLAMFSIKESVDNFKALNRVNTPVTDSAENKNNTGVYSYDIRNYVGKNAMDVGKQDGNYFVDEYGSAKLKIVFKTVDGTYLDTKNLGQMNQYTIVAQSIKADEKLNVFNQKNAEGNSYKNLIDYQSYEEIVLVVANGKGEFTEKLTAPKPIPDRYTYYIKDYVGRNALSIGEITNNTRVDKYGNSDLIIVFINPDGTSADISDENQLKDYVVTSQDIPVNSKQKIEYETNSNGVEYRSLIKNKTYKKIDLTIEKIEK